MSQNNTGELSPERIFQMAFGYAPPLILEAAIRNRVFDVLDAGSKSVEQVSEETGASTRGLRAIMNALVGLDFLTKDASGVYALTPESSAFLVSTKPSFQGGLLQHTSTRLIPKWLPISEVVRTGKPSSSINQEKMGAEFFIELVQDIFPMSYRAAQVLGDSLGLADAAEPVGVLDLAAGSGVWGIALAQKSSEVTVTAVDWPEVLEVTKQYAARFDLTARFRFVAGDLADADFGNEHQVAVLGHILHSEGEARSRNLLRKVFQALAPGGQIVIAEMVPNEDRRGPVFSLLFAVNMLVNTDEGDTYTFNEIEGWLKEAGFTETRSLDAPSPSPLIIATKPG